MLNKVILIPLIFLFILTGCANKLGVREAESESSLSLTKENVLVFGKIKWIQNDKVKEITSWYGNLNVNLRLIRLEDMNEGIIRKIEKNGNFFAILPKGTYIIRQVDWTTYGGGYRWLIPKVSFNVLTGHHSYYIGTIVVDTKTEQNIFGERRVKEFKISIEDEEKEAMKSLNIRYSQSELITTKSLIIHDVNMPVEGIRKQNRFYDFIQILNSSPLFK